MARNVECAMLGMKTEILHSFFSIGFWFQVEFSYENVWTPARVPERSLGTSHGLVPGSTAISASFCRSAHSANPACAMLGMKTEILHSFFQSVSGFKLSFRMKTYGPGKSA